MRGLVAVVLLGGCELVFPLTPPDNGDDAVDAEVRFDGAPDAPNDAMQACVGVPDEDGDGANDGCDLCPHVVGPHADTDGDAVGDECDPHVPYSADRWVHFEGWNTLDPAVWTPYSAGQWSAANGELLASSIGAGHLIYVPAIARPGMIEAAFVLPTTPPGSGIVQYAGVEVAFDGASSFACLAINDAVSIPRVILYRWEMGDGLTALTGSESVTRGVPFRIRVGIEDGSPFCAVDGTVLMFGVMVPVVTDQLVAAGFHIRNGSVTVPYAAIIHW